VGRRASRAIRPKRCGPISRPRQARSSSANRARAKQSPGGDPAWEQLGFDEDAPPALIERYGIFSIYVVERGEKEAMASLFRDKATKKPLPRRRGIYWELDTHSDTWAAHTRYANLVLVWFSEQEQPTVDARWRRLHRMLRDLTAA
jgi:hypothetical protein